MVMVIVMMMDAHGNPQHKHDQSVFMCHHISQLQIDLTIFRMPFNLSTYPYSAESLLRTVLSCTL